MEFLFRSVVEHEVCLAERNLVIELMCPRVSQLRECLVCETTKDYLLLLHLALDEDDHVGFVANSLNELFYILSCLVLNLNLGLFVTGPYQLEVLSPIIKGHLLLNFFHSIYFHVYLV